MNLENIHPDIDRGHLSIWVQNLEYLNLYSTTLFQRIAKVVHEGGALVDAKLYPEYSTETEEFFDGEYFTKTIKPSSRCEERMREDLRNFGLLDHAGELKDTWRSLILATTTLEEGKITALSASTVEEYVLHHARGA